MNVKYQIFVSSTYTDLIEERRIVMEQILNLGHIPVGMELFQAADESQWSHIKKRILDCDYYILILSERYGSIGAKGKSYTQMEYEFASSSGVPVISFLLHEDARASLARDKVEFDKQSSINSFRKICQRKLVKHWRNPDDLAAKVAVSLVALMADSPRIGWVRANTVAPEMALNEISKLSEEKRRLQDQISALEAAENSIKVPQDILYRIDLLKNKKATDYDIKISENDTDGPKINENIDLLEIFLYCVKEFSLSPSMSSVRNIIIKYIFPKTENVDGYYLSTIQQPAAREILAEFATQNLIRIEKIQTYSFDKPSTTNHVALTDYGKQLAFSATLPSQRNAFADQNNGRHSSEKI